MNKTILITICLSAIYSLATLSCRDYSSPQEGVSIFLAEERVENISDVRYELFFDIPQEKNTSISGKATLTFELASENNIVIDYMYGDNITDVSLPYSFENEHIIIDKSYMTKGENSITITFNVSDHSLNRRDDFLYTLLVPDRARTLFPCFDQPDLKGKYDLTLLIPEKWMGISNGSVLDSTVIHHKKKIHFSTTEPLSTYLFSFVAGAFNKVTCTQDGRTVNMYHKETDKHKLSQCYEIIYQVFSSLKWLENYTQIKYPFSKYDFIVLPGFQYGGMEHTGATLYNDKKIFLSEHPTLDEELSRTKLIAHETAHIWFGDYVTMKWFSEVWTKEVFANYFASQITNPLFPDVNHDLSFLISYIPGAYSEDRTLGTNPISQRLTNLNQAGLVYGNIIYQKSPVIMNMLVSKMGEEQFRIGIRKYLNNFAYGNATWEDLISILDELTEENLKQWSSNWMNEKGMPKVQIARKGDTITLTQEGAIRGQNISFLVDGDSLTTYLDSAEKTILIPEGSKTIIPNFDGKSYGYFFWGSDEMLSALAQIGSFLDPVTRASILIMCYEAAIRRDIDIQKFITIISRYIEKEDNQLIYSLSISYLENLYLKYGLKPNIALENTLWKIASDNNEPARSIIALRTLVHIMDSEEMVEKVDSFYHNTSLLDREKISERDRVDICFELSLRYPERCNELLLSQRSMIKDPNLLKEFDFLSPAVSPDEEVRDSVFNALLLAKNREIEPYAEKSLALLNHRLREEESRKYILPALDIMIDVQKTGDIFFPKGWASSLLRSHNQSVVKESVSLFFKDKPDYPPMLKNKILMQVID